MKENVDFKSGAEHARDLIRAEIIGLQNELRCLDCEEYKAYQKVLKLITDRHGRMCTEWKS
jgi:hypothetical protein